MNYPFIPYKRRQLFHFLRWSTFAMWISLAVMVFLFKPVSSQQHTLLNTPPVLYVPERNWRIDEKEQVGQIISRVRAEDAENDELVFGLEPHFHYNYAQPNNNYEVKQSNLPFWIDPTEGIVYLNESLVGRAGEDFFFYVTVSDGQLTAKSEIFVNILGKQEKKNIKAKIPISNIVQNISQFFPSFDQLPGVQSVKNPHSSQNPFSSFSPGFGISSNSASHSPSLNFYPTNSQVFPSSIITGNNTLKKISSEEAQINSISAHTALQTTTEKMTNRTKLSLIDNESLGIGINNNMTKNNKNIFNSSRDSSTGNSDQNTDSDTSKLSKDTIAYSFKTIVIPIAIAGCGCFLVGALIFGYMYRRRFCAIGKNIKHKSKEEKTKISNQSSSNPNSTNESHNSIVLQHWNDWNGPMAYGNRYVPWEIDQQLQQTNTAPTSSQIGHVDPCITNNTSQSNRDIWEFPRHRLKFFNILGEGAFGQVWRCEAIDIEGAESVRTVAVKTLKENSTEVDRKDLLSELEVMKSLEPHVNVVRFLGCCTDKDPIFVIIEYVNRGKLQTYLRNSRAERNYGNTHGKSNILTSSDLTSFMYQVAKGMEYLTARGIIHRDLAARNILINSDHTCKIADFGFARDVVTSKIYERKSEGKLPIRWMAIESLYDNIFSVKSDVWSFGILMWEIVTLGSTPYPGISAADVMKKVRDGYRLEKPEHCRRELYNIMYYCWSSNAKERPLFLEIVQMLEKLLHTEMDYIELERFPDHNYYNIVNPSGEKV